MATYIPVSTVDVVDKSFPMSNLVGKKVRQALPIFSEYNVAKCGGALSYTFLLVDKNGLILEKIKDDTKNAFHSFSELKLSPFSQERAIRTKTFVDAARDIQTGEIVVAICLHLDVDGGYIELDDLYGPIANILRNAQSRHAALLVAPVIPPSVYAKSTGEP